MINSYFCYVMKFLHKDVRQIQRFLQNQELFIYLSSILMQSLSSSVQETTKSILIDQQEHKQEEEEEYQQVYQSLIDTQDKQNDPKQVQKQGEEQISNKDNSDNNKQNSQNLLDQMTEIDEKCNNDKPVDHNFDKLLIQMTRSSTIQQSTQSENQNNVPKKKPSKVQCSVFSKKFSQIPFAERFKDKLNVFTKVGKICKIGQDGKRISDKQSQFCLRPYIKSGNIKRRRIKTVLNEKSKTSSEDIVGQRSRLRLNASVSITPVSQTLLNSHRSSLQSRKSSRRSTRSMSNTNPNTQRQSKGDSFDISEIKQQQIEETSVKKDPLGGKIISQAQKSRLIRKFSSLNTGNNDKNQNLLKQFDNDNDEKIKIDNPNQDKDKDLKENYRSLYMKPSKGKMIKQRKKDKSTANIGGNMKIESLPKILSRYDFTQQSKFSKNIRC